MPEYRECTEGRFEVNVEHDGDNNRSEWQNCGGCDEPPSGERDTGIDLPATSIAGRNPARFSKGHFSGFLVAGEGAGRVIQIESHLEMKTALILFYRKGVIDLEEQVPFPWRDRDGKLRTHFFDFRVTLVDGTRIAITVKPERGLKSGEFQEKVTLIAEQVASDFADRVRIFTNNDIDPIELHNAEILHAFREPDTEADAKAQSITRELAGSASLGGLAQEIGLGSRGFRALVRQIQTNRLSLRDPVRISPDAFVQQRKAA